MTGKIKILFLDDNLNDIELIQHQLKKDGLDYSSEITQDRVSYEKALKNFKPDIVLSDYSMPSFDGLTAFSILQTILPETPFVFISGTIDEENASELIKSGVTDYILKHKLFEITRKIIRALKEAEERKEKRITDEKLKIEHEKLIQSEVQIRNFAHHLNQVMEDERAHLAREIHDELGQQLVGIKIGLSFIKGEDNKTNTTIDGLMKNVDETIQSLRKIATGLRPGILDSLGLVPSIAWLVSEFEKKTKIKCLLQLPDNEEKFEKNLSTCFFRICQESLINIAKHAGASEVTIVFERNKNILTLKIADNGKGIITKKLDNPFSMGLLGMQERAKAVGGNIDITSLKNKGTTILLNATV